MSSTALLSHIDLGVQHVIDYPSSRCRGQRAGLRDPDSSVFYTPHNLLASLSPFVFILT